MFDCEIDTSEVERAWVEACGVLADGVNRGVERGVEAGAEQARGSHAYQDHSHSLTDSIRGYLERSAARVAGGEAIGVLVAGAKHASFVEEGTSPHDIRPKEGHGFEGPLQKGQSRRTKKDVGTHRVALRWTDGSGQHFAAVVHHPGGRSLPFMGPAVQKAERVIEVEAELAAERAATLMGK